MDFCGIDAVFNYGAQDWAGVAYVADRFFAGDYGPRREGAVTDAFVCYLVGVDRHFDLVYFVAGDRRRYRDQGIRTCHVFGVGRCVIVRLHRGENAYVQARTGEFINNK